MDVSDSTSGGLDRKSPQASINRLVAIIEQRMKLWEDLSKHAHDQVGPLRSLGSFDRSPGKPSTSIRDLIHQLPPGTEHQEDGARTTVVMAYALFSQLFTRPDAELYNMPLDQFRQILEANWGALEDARRTIFDYLRQPGAAFPRQDLRAVGACTDLDAWLLRKAIKIPDGILAKIDLAAPERASLPFMAFYEREAGYTFERIKAYWLEGGLYALLFDNAAGKDDRWEETRLQLTAAAPYVLVCDGTLRGRACGKMLAEAIVAVGEQKPVVIIIAAGIDSDVSFDDSYYAIVLPGPARRSDTRSPTTPALEDMARAFKTDVVSLPETQSELTLEQWRMAVKHLGRCRVAQIDRQRAILAPNEKPDARPTPSYRRLDQPTRQRDVLSSARWRLDSLDALVLPLRKDGDDIPSVAKAEALLRARIEAEHGVVAGAGTGLYWLAERIRADQGSPTWWLKEALRAPMLQILRNIGVSPETHTALFEEVTGWISAGDRPWRTFLIEHTQNDRVRVPESHPQDRIRSVDQNTVLAWGDVSELGVFTPVGQISRMVERGVQMAGYIASLDYLKHRH